MPKRSWRIKACGKGWYNAGYHLKRSRFRRFRDFCENKKAMVYELRFLQFNAGRGYAHAQFNLGMCYMYGIGVGKDEAEAVRLFQLAADQGYAPAQYNLGLLYFQNGMDAEAVRLYQLAANQGYADAQYGLGWCYANGTGVRKDEAEAVRLYRLAAEQDHEIAKDCLINL